MFSEPLPRPAAAPQDRERAGAWPQTDLATQAVTNEWLVSLLRFGGMLCFALIGWFLPPAERVDLYTLYLFILVGFIYNFYVIYQLHSGAVQADLAHSISFFLFSDILLLVALAHFSNIFQTWTLAFHLFLILTVCLRVSFLKSLVTGVLVVLAYLFSDLMAVDHAVRPLSLLADSAGLMAVAAFCGWFSAGKNRAWRMAEDLAGRLLSVERDLGDAQRRADRFRRLQESQQEFCTMMSHELRTPLTGIIGYNDLLLLGEAGPLNETQRQFLSEMMDKEQDLLCLIENVLDLHRIQSGRWVLRLESVPPDKLIADALAALALEARKKGVEVIHLPTPGAPLPDVTVDREKVMRVLLNVIGNAIKFTPAGGAVRIAATLAGDPDLERNFPHLITSSSVISFAVMDNGSGVAPEDRPNIFKMFYRGRHENHDDMPRGAGLGLAIAKEIVELHWGRIGYEPAAGSGSTFRFTLPVCPLRIRRRIALRKSRFNLGDLLNGLLLQFDEDLRWKNLTVARHGWPAGGDSLAVQADRQLMQCVLFNILNNKIHYAYPQSEMIITVQLDPPAEWLTIRIANEGEGVDPVILERIAGDEAGGKGVDATDLRQANVNLSLARDIVESHGGALSFESQGRGTEVTVITMPVGAPPAKREVYDEQPEDSHSRG